LFFGIPVSSTQCFVRAVTALGLISGHWAIDWVFFAKICANWVGLFFIAVVFTAGFFSFCYYAPGAEYLDYQVAIVGKE
jgi:phosphate/sulfate permease